MFIKLFITLIITAGLAIGIQEAYKDFDNRSVLERLFN